MILVELMALVPPRFWAIVIVPVVVGVACVVRWGKGGREMWGYAEEWVLIKENKVKEAEAATVEAVVAPVAGGDEKVAPPAYEVLFEADVKEAPADVKA